MINEQYQNDEAVRAELLKTLEYYFSSKNLSKDEYLISQMDDQFYVCIDEIAKFNKIKTLTNDKQFIREIIQQSCQLELDPDTGNKVRSVNGKLGGSYQPKSVQAVPNVSQQRSVLILREVAPEATMQLILSLFENKEPVCPVCEKCESAGNDSWYVTFSNEDQAQRALQYLKTEVKVFMDRPIKARIKAHAMPRSNTGGGFLSTLLTPTSTPPPPPPQQPPLNNTQSNAINVHQMQTPLYTPSITFIPGAQLNSPPMVIQAGNQTAYEIQSMYPAATNWPMPINAPIQNGLFLFDVNQPFNTPPIDVDNNSSNSSQSSLNQNSPKPNIKQPTQPSSQQHQHHQQNQHHHQNQHHQQQHVYNGPFIPGQNHSLGHLNQQQHFVTQANAFYAPAHANLFDEQKNLMPPAPIHLNQSAATPGATFTFFYHPLQPGLNPGLVNQTMLNPIMANHVTGSAQPAHASSQMQSSSTSSSSSSPKLNQHQHQHYQHHHQQHYRQRADAKVANIQANGKYSGVKSKAMSQNSRGQYASYAHDSNTSSGLSAQPVEKAPSSKHEANENTKRNKSPLVFNSDSSFPPLNPAPTKNITISLQNLPVPKANEESNETPNDPAIISCYKSTDYIPNSPTIIKSSSIIDSKCQESKKATSETLANILNHDQHKHDRVSTHYHHNQKKYDNSYQRNKNHNSSKQTRSKNDSNRYLRASNSSNAIALDSAEHKRKMMHKDERISVSVNHENYANYTINDEDALLANCWNKKLTFAEIVQKAGSTSPSPTKSSNDSESNAAELNSPQPIAAE